MNYNVIIVFLILSGFCSSIAGLNIPSIPSGHHHHKKEERWAVLMAGFNGYGSYGHQADVCHAYQVLKAGGFRDTHIIVFMYDDIAWNKDNPNPGVIINKPNGSDVYHGVPKDYTGIDVNAINFYAVILGQKNILTAGRRKVVKSGLNDHIFIYIASHSYVGGIGMPDGNVVTATEFNRVLMKKFQGSLNLAWLARRKGDYLAEMSTKKVNVEQDADWGCDIDDRKSIGGYCVYFGDNLVSWSSKKQNVVARSSTESEYRALAAATAEVTWINSLLLELKVKTGHIPIIWCDNNGAASLAVNPVNHGRTKHIEIDVHFVRNKVLAKELEVYDMFLLMIKQLM